jgi:hypothetical protein
MIYADGVFDDKEHDALKYIAQKLHFPIHELASSHIKRNLDFSSS